MFTLIFKRYWATITYTWILVFLENILWISIPLFLGRAVDGMLAQSYQEFYILIAVFSFSLFIMVLRRLLDTRAYGKINENMIAESVQSQQESNVDISKINARVNFVKETTDFFENDLPMLIQSMIQLIGSIGFLLLIHYYLSSAVAIAFICILIMYILCKPYYQKINGKINNIKEKELRFLYATHINSLFKKYLNAAKKRSIQLSDIESINFGIAMTFVMFALMVNVYIATAVMQLSTGQIFSVVSYTFEFAEAVFILPMILQNFYRTQEISGRISKFHKDTTETEEKNI